MWNLLEQAGVVAYPTLALFVAGLAVTVTKGRKSGRPGAYAAAWTVAVLASAQVGFAAGLVATESAVQKLPAAELAKHVDFLGMGVRESGQNLLLGGLCGLVLMAVGGVLAVMSGKSAQ